MRWFRLIYVGACFALLGCGAQLGKFTANTEKGALLTPQCGLLDVVSGFRRSGEPDAVEENLLYLLVVSQDNGIHDYSGSSEHGKYVTRLTFSWRTDTGRINIPVSWDRESDMVIINGRSFSREQGNVFVVEREKNGQIAGQQLPSLGPQAHFSEILSHIQQELPGDRLIAPLKIDGSGKK